MGNGIRKCNQLQMLWLGSKPNVNQISSNVGPLFFVVDPKLLPPHDHVGACLISGQKKFRGQAKSFLIDPRRKICFLFAFNTWRLTSLERFVVCPLLTELAFALRIFN